TRTAVLPVTITGASTDTSPSSGPSGAMIATTPDGSGVEKLKNGPETGFADPVTCANLSAHPAYQTQRSTAASTSAPAAALVRPVARSSSVNWSRRPSSISATR